MEKQAGIKSIVDIRNAMISFFKEWPATINTGDYSIDYFVSYFDHLLKFKESDLNYIEYNNGYYIGCTQDGKEDGIGMAVYPAPSLQGCIQFKSYIGYWGYGHKFPSGIWISKMGEIDQWFIQLECYNADEELEGYGFRINHEGIIEFDAENGKIKNISRQIEDSKIYSYNSKDINTYKGRELSPNCAIQRITSDLKRYLYTNDDWPRVYRVDDYYKKKLIEPFNIFLKSRSYTFRVVSETLFLYGDNGTVLSFKPIETIIESGGGYTVSVTNDSEKTTIHQEFDDEKCYYKYKKEGRLSFLITPIDGLIND